MKGQSISGFSAKEQLPIIISASRMTDLPGYYPQELINSVKTRIEKGTQLHTLVLWTKHPGSLLMNPLKEFLLSLRQEGIQLYLQCTITGLGKKAVGKCSDGTDLILEPQAPTLEEAMVSLPEVIDLLGKPERLRLRIDPIVRIQDALGQQFSNLGLVPEILSRIKHLGIQAISFSFLEVGVHRKVDRRFTDLGVKILPPNQKERLKTARWLKELELSYRVVFNSCCVPGFPESKCIDGRLLQTLHDQQAKTYLTEPRKRASCGCTHSIDIGGWPPKTCFTACRYCYAKPAD